VDNDPFWIGHLKRYSIDNTTGNINSTPEWDAGSQSSGQSPINSNIVFTYKNNVRTLFVDDTSKITNADLGLTSDNTGNNKRDAIFAFMGTGETNTVTVGTTPITYTKWLLGDIYHFSPVTIGVPSQYYADIIDMSGPITTSCSSSCDTSVNAYAQFYCLHCDRTSAGGKRIILAGANDGQFHAFKAASSANGGGTEVWSFIPPNFLPSLQLIAHTAHPTALTHTYFVDGSVGAFDVWWPNVGTDTTGANKNVADWHTLAVINEGRGGNATGTLWSKSSSCDNTSYPKGFYSKYKDTTVNPNVYYPNYCGYWALDVTNTTNLPTVQWRLKTETDYVAAAHLGDPWSKMVMGRVKISGNEKWVGFIGGGYSGNDCSDHTKTCGDIRGKSFYVIDLKDGSILKKWTHSSNETGNTGSSNNYDLDYDLAGIAGIIDSDNDGFIDTAYIGDTGGNVWRFKFCAANDGNSCKTDDWAMAKLYNSSNAKTPIYTIISSTPGVPNYDDAGTWWLFFGTGDSTNPNKFNTSDKFFAVKDINRASSVVLSDLKDISTSTFDHSNTGADKSKKGFYIRLTHTDAGGDNGEKIMANPTIFDGVLFFTTYVPKDACLLDGDAYVYVIDFENSKAGISGAGLLKDSNGNAIRSLTVGTGVSSSPIVSYSPNLQGVDVFISTSQTNSSGSLTQKISLGNLFNFQKSKLLYWHDMRVQ
jgi:Tfp pilus assembly protein, tip-associated adhesin PilY1